MAPEVDLGWGDPPKDPGGPPPAPPNPDLAGPEPGEYRYDDTIAASDGVKRNFLLTAFGAVGNMFRAAGGWLLYDGVELIVTHWRLLVVGLASLCLLALQRTGWAKADPIFVFVAGSLAAAWVIVSYWSGGYTENDEEADELKPRKRQKLTKEERLARRKSRLAFWGTESHPFPKQKKISLASQVGGFITSGALLIGGIALMACVALWELGAKIFARPIDKTRPYGDRKPNWVVISVFCALIPLSVLAGMNLPGAWDARGKMLAGITMPALPQLPEIRLPEVRLPKFRWPTWGKGKPQMATVLPVPTPTPGVTVTYPPPPATAWGGGFKRKPDPPAPVTSVPVAAVPPAPAAAPPPVAAPAPAPTLQPVGRPRPTKSVAQIKREVREIEREVPVFVRQAERELAELERERKAAEAKANAAKKQPVPTPRPTTLMAVMPPASSTVAQVVQPIGMTQIQKLEAELERVRKERDEARQKAATLATRPVPTPITVIKTATVSVPGPERIVERKVPGPVRVVRQVQEVRVKVPGPTRTVTKTRTVVRTVPGPERVVIRNREVPGPTRTVVRTVRVPVSSPPRVVYRERVVAAAAVAGKGSDPAPMAQRKRVRPQQPPRVVVRAQQPAASNTTTSRSSSDPYGGDPYDY